MASLFQIHQRLSARQVKALISLQLCAETWQPVCKRPLDETDLVSESDLQHDALSTDSPQALSLLVTGTCTTCFPLPVGCLCGLLLYLPPPCCELFDSWLLPDGISSSDPGFEELIPLT